MKSICSFLLLMFFFINQILGQENKQTQLSLIQGIWENIMNSDNEKSFVITKRMNSLNFTYTNDPSKLDFPLSETIKGFQSNFSESKDSININSLREDGKYYTVIFKEDLSKTGWVKSSSFLIPDYFQCNGNKLSINGGQLVEYMKIERLPSFALKMLYKRGEIDKRNYIKEYLDIDVRMINVEKCNIYLEPNVATKMYLLKGDIVTIKEKKESWLKIEFEGKKLVQGWIKKQEVK